MTRLVNPAKLQNLEKGESLWVGAWYRLRQNRMAMFSAAFILLLVLLCFGLPLFMDLDYKGIQSEKYFTPPGQEYLMGSDHLGRDQFARILYGGRISLLVGMAATLVSLTIGISYGAISGYFGGRTDRVMMRIVDVLYALPFTMFVILLMVLFGDNILLMFAAIGAVEWLTMARIVRGQVISLKKQEFIESCHSLGLRAPRIIFRHMVPNILGPVIVYTTLTIPAVMILESFLSFLGLGVQPPMTSWGTLIKDGADRTAVAWWMLVFPGAFFALTLFSFNFLGDGLRDALDPKTTRKG
jgi:oligopeptide transport system permease protein